jgi:hypothetical protein
MDLVDLLTLIILAALYQKIWYALRDHKAHHDRVERLLADIRDAIRSPDDT